MKKAILPLALISLVFLLGVSNIVVGEVNETTTTVPTTTTTTIANCSDDFDCPPKMKCELPACGVGEYCGEGVCVGVGCLGEGGLIPGAISPEYREHMATECCEGLRAIVYYGNYDENCNWLPLAGAPSGVCSRCGNGVCESWETKCTCSADCAPPPDVCEKFYTCPDGTVVRYCEMKEQYEVTGAIGTACICTNPKYLCPITTTTTMPGINITRECAARITITFSQDVYYPGDYGKVVVEIFDAAGNRLPYYPFYVEISHAGGTQGPTLYRTDANGYYINTGRITESNVYMGITTFTVFTEETKNCARVQNSAQIEFRGRDIYEPVCGNGICEPGEGKYCIAPIGRMVCEEGEKCEIPQPVCRIACPEDCEQETTFGYIGEEFRLRINQKIKFSQYGNLEITLNNIIIPVCIPSAVPQPPPTAQQSVQPIPEPTGGVEGAIATGVITGEMVKILTGEIFRIVTGGVVAPETGTMETGEIPEVYREIEEHIIEIVPAVPVTIKEGIPVSTECTGISPFADITVKIGRAEGVFRVSLGEKKKILGRGAIPNSYNADEELAITFIEYDAQTNTGSFIVEKLPVGVTLCPANCKCDSDGNIIKCWTGVEECPAGTMLCPDGTCRRSCTIGNITTECNFGCFYGEKCLPIGVRIKGQYCAISGDLLPQIAKGECENNFECQTNLCIDDECIQRGLWRRIMEFFARFWRRGD